MFSLRDEHVTVNPVPKVTYTVVRTRPVLTFAVHSALETGGFLSKVCFTIMSKLQADS
jgi:hypothetical protein